MAGAKLKGDGTHHPPDEESIEDSDEATAVAALSNLSPAQPLSSRLNCGVSSGSTNDPGATRDDDDDTNMSPVITEQDDNDNHFEGQQVQAQTQVKKVMSPKKLISRSSTLSSSSAKDLQRERQRQHEHHKKEKEKEESKYQGQDQDRGQGKGPNLQEHLNQSSYRIKLRHHIGSRSSTPPRKRSKLLPHHQQQDQVNHKGDDDDQASSSGISSNTNISNSSSENRCSSGYEGGKSTSNRSGSAGSSDSLLGGDTNGSGGRSGSGSGSGSDGGMQEGGGGEVEMMDIMEVDDAGVREGGLRSDCRINHDNGGGKSAADHRRLRHPHLCGSEHSEDGDVNYVNDGKSVKFSMKLNSRTNNNNGDKNGRKSKNQIQQNQQQQQGLGGSPTSSSDDSSSDDVVVNDGILLEDSSNNKHNSSTNNDMMDEKPAAAASHSAATTTTKEGEHRQSSNHSCGGVFPNSPTSTKRRSGNVSSASATATTTTSETVPSIVTRSAMKYSVGCGGRVKSSVSSDNGNVVPAALKNPEDEKDDNNDIDIQMTDVKQDNSTTITTKRNASDLGSPVQSILLDATQQEAPDRAASVSVSTNPTNDRTAAATAEAPSKSTNNITSSSYAVAACPTASSRQLRPAPYFYYIDHSQDRDEDPTSPLSQPLYVPNFAAKMHAILIREELSSIITWMPHGRSWKILNPKEFEIQILPIYFNHTKMASFYRQANGWGFRRMLKGSDKGSFYNEAFLRGLPHLAKKMARTGGVKIVDDQKLDSNIAHEPNLWMISEEHPVPESVDKSSFSYTSITAINKCVLDGGPKARMPLLPVERHNARKAADAREAADSAPPVGSQSDQENANNSDEKQSSESSFRGTGHSDISAHSGSSNVLSANAVAHVAVPGSHASSSSLSYATLPSSSQQQQMNVLMTLARQQGQGHQLQAALNQQIALSQQQHQFHYQQSFISAQAANAQQQQQQQQRKQIPQSQPQPHQPVYHAFVNPAVGPNVAAAGMSVLAGMNIGPLIPSQPQQQQQQGSTVARAQQSQQPNVNPVNNAILQQQDANLDANNNNAAADANNLVEAGFACPRRQFQRRQQQVSLSNPSSSATSTSTSYVFVGRKAGDQSRQSRAAACAPSWHELKRLLNTILSEHQAGRAQQQQQPPPPQQQHQQQQQNSAYNAMAPGVVQELVARAIILGAQYGAESVMKQTSSSSESNGNNDGSSDTA